jgi:hypothetical protein
MQQLFLCLTCERDVSDVSHIRGYTTFSDIQRDWQSYLVRGLLPAFCTLCDEPVNTILVNGDALTSMPDLPAGKDQ